MLILLKTRQKGEKNERIYLEKLETSVNEITMLDDNPRKEGGIEVYIELLWLAPTSLKESMKEKLSSILDKLMEKLNSYDKLFFMITVELLKNDKTKKLAQTNDPFTHIRNPLPKLLNDLIKGIND